MTEQRAQFDPAVRATMARAVEEFGLRSMAREVAMSPSGLRKLLDSAGAPYAKTRRRLEAWYSAWGTERPIRARDIALDDLVRTFAAQQQKQARERFDALLSELTAGIGVSIEAPCPR
jgi:hypothetical protein